MSEQPKSIEDLSPEQRKELEEKIKKMSPKELANLQKQQCIFCQIISGKIPSKKVFEDDKVIAVMDIQPATKGHLLILPKEHYAIMPQVPEEIIGHMFVTSKRLSQAMLRGLKVSGTSLFIANGQAAGQRSQHFMIHLVPRIEGDKLFDAPENVVEKAMQQKVKIAVEEKILSLLGVEKQTTLKDVKEPEAESEPTPEPEKKPKIDDSEDVKKDSEDETLENDGLDEEELQEDEIPERDTETEKEDKAEDDDVSLDDIANLFK